MRVSKLEMETKEDMVWNCNSSTFCLSLREFKNPAFSLPNAASSGAKMVSPPEPEVMSWELSWLISWVVLRRRIRTENFLAFLRIWTMSMVGDLGMARVGATEGDVGTSGTELMPGAAAGAAAAGTVAGGEGGVGVG